MSRKFSLLLSLALILILLLVFPRKSLADYKEVLGVSESVLSALQVPPTVEGPGFILPDSPFFFLDKLKQNIRLFLAFTPEEKAKVYASVAGERLAELRFELAKNNLNAVKIALEGVSDNLSQAAAEVGAAKLAGKNVSALAKTINDDIKEKQQTLDVLQMQTTGELKARLNTTQTSLLKSKVEAEDALPENELENEVRDDLNRLAQQKVREASSSARQLEADINELQKQASSAAQNSLSKRQKALEKAIEEKNEALKKVEEKLLEKEKEKQSKFLEVQNKAVEKAREAVAKAQEAARKFEEIQKSANEIRNKALPASSGNSGSSNNSSSGSNSNSSGGSSKSGSSGGSSGSSGGGDSGKSGGEDHGGKSGKD